jgi:hypothetical protein
MVSEQVCKNGTTNCTRLGTEHQCESSTDIQSRQEFGAKYAEGLRQKIEALSATNDHRALVIADLTRKLEAKTPSEEVELALLCAQDIVNNWPTLTFRTLVTMTKRVDTLRQALENVKK